MKSLKLSKIIIVFIMVSTLCFSFESYSTKAATLWNYAQYSDIALYKINQIQSVISDGTNNNTNNNTNKNTNKNTSNNAINVIAISKDDKWIARATKDKVILSNIITGASLKQWNLSTAPSALALSKNKKHLAIGFRNGSITVIELRTNKADILNSDTLESADYPILKISFEEDAILSYTIKGPGRSAIENSIYYKIRYNKRDNRVISCLPVESSIQKQITSEDRSLAITSKSIKSRHNKITLNIAVKFMIGNLIKEKFFNNQEITISCMVLSPSARTLAVGDKNGSVTVYQAPQETTLLKRCDLEKLNILSDVIFSFQE